MTSNEHLQRYYSRILTAKRVNGPTYAEAARDMAAQVQLAVLAG